MKNFQIHPFEKNNYFYGKLLTSKDFEVEQKYFNDKRFLLNRLMYGAGVVIGLNVVGIDDQTITLEAGVGLDVFGREIIVANPVAYKLPMIDGFHELSFRNAAYLCIEYLEKGKEQVHSVEKNFIESSVNTNYNRMQESYRLYFVDEDEVMNDKVDTSMINDTKVIYNGSEMLIKQRVPKFAKAEEVIDIDIFFEKKNENHILGFSYDLDIKDGMWLEPGDSKIDFNEIIGSDKKNYHIKRLVKVGSKSELENITIKNNNIQIVIDSERIDKKVDIKHEITLISGPVKDYVKNTYSMMDFSEKVEKNSYKHLYLAKLDLIQVGTRYVINRVDSLPFSQVVYNNYLTSQLSELNGNSSSDGLLVRSSTEEVEFNQRAKVTVQHDDKINQLDFKFEIPKTKVVYENMTTGTIEVNLEENFKFAKSFVSDEIEHKLGLGPVLLQVGVEDKPEELGGEEKIFYGDSIVFYKNIDPPCGDYQIGTIVYPKKGTFKVGIRLQTGRKGTTYTLRWWAYRQLTDANKANMKTFFVEPDEIQMNFGEKYQFSAIFTNMDSQNREEITWKVEEKELGTIDENGLFTAFDIAGTATIVATLSSNESVSSRGFAEIINKNKKSILKKAKIGK